MTNSTPNPKTWAKGEYRKRLAEMAIMFSWILPIYSKESREVFRLTFQEDIAIVFPTFFRDLSIHCIKYPERTREYLEFIKEATSYILEETENRPKVDIDEDKLQDLLHKWMSGLPK